jgi:hypothetical protein
LTDDPICCGLFYDAVRNYIIQYQMIGQNNDELERICKEATMPNRCTIGECAWKDWGIPQKPGATADIPTEIRTDYLPNTSLQRYSYPTRSVYRPIIRR